MLALAFTVTQVGAFRSRARAALQDEEEATARRRASLRRAHASRATSPQAEGRYAVGGMTSSSKSRGRRNMYMYMHMHTYMYMYMYTCVVLQHNLALGIALSLWFALALAIALALAVALTSPSLSPSDRALRSSRLEAVGSACCSASHARSASLPLYSLSSSASRQPP